MASTVTVTPTLGFGQVASQVGPALGYDAIDLRRAAGAGVTEGILTDLAYKVSQRAAGANLSVDVDADAGGVRVQGDSVSHQGLYVVAPSSANLNVDIAAADATNPRNDLVILEVKDDTHDASGLNIARVRVVTGTPNASAAMTDAFGVNGTPALPSSSVPLAVVNVPALDTAITDSQIDDRRYRTAGKSIIATEESRTNTAYGLLTTPDSVRNVVLAEGGLLAVGFQGLWKSSVASAGLAAIFLNSVQVVAGGAVTNDPQEVDANSTANTYVNLMTHGGGLMDSNSGVANPSHATTGMILGNGSAADVPNYGGVCYIFAAAGTYDVSVRFKATSGSVTAKERKLWVWTQPFPV